MQTKPDK